MSNRIDNIAIKKIKVKKSTPTKTRTKKKHNFSDLLKIDHDLQKDKIKPLEVNGSTVLERIRQRERISIETGQREREQAVKIAIQNEKKNLKIKELRQLVVNILREDKLLKDGVFSYRQSIQLVIDSSGGTVSEDEIIEVLNGLLPINKRNYFKWTDIEVAINSTIN